MDVQVPAEQCSTFTLKQELNLCSIAQLGCSPLRCVAHFTCADKTNGYTISSIFSIRFQLSFFVFIWCSILCVYNKDMHLAEDMLRAPFLSHVSLKISNAAILGKWWSWQFIWWNDYHQLYQNIRWSASAKYLKWYHWYSYSFRISIQTTAIKDDLIRGYAPTCDKSTGVLEIIGELRYLSIGALALAS